MNGIHQLQFLPCRVKEDERMQKSINAFILSMSGSEYRCRGRVGSTERVGSRVRYGNELVRARIGSGCHN